MVVEKVAVVGGAGLMGRGIAQELARIGLQVAITDQTAQVTLHGLEVIHRYLDKGVELGKTSQEDADGIKSRIRAGTDFEDAVGDVDLVVEAVFEDLGIKQDVFRRLYEACLERTILASNTSAIPIQEIASVSARRDRVVGMHFFNPVASSDLIEVVPTADTSEETLATTLELATRTGKCVIISPDIYGFTATPMGIALAFQAVRGFEAGASIRDIDAAMVHGYGHKMGPIMTGDLVGIKTRVDIGKVLAPHRGSHFEPPEILLRMVEVGDLGRSVKRGFYDWTVEPARPRDVELRALMVA